MFKNTLFHAVSTKCLTKILKIDHFDHFGGWWFQLRLFSRTTILMEIFVVENHNVSEKCFENVKRHGETYTSGGDRNVSFGRVDDASRSLEVALWKGDEEEKKKVRQPDESSGSRGKALRNATADENTTKSSARTTRKRWIKETAVLGTVFLTTSSRPFLSCSESLI